MRDTLTELGARAYEPRKYDALYKMSGFSEELLSTHFKLYEGYVANANALLEKTPELLKAGDAVAYAEAKRRFGWEFDGMRLHELYFDGLGGDGEPDLKSALHQALAAQFGRFEAWKEDFTATGAMRGIGWALLCEDPVTGRLLNTWIDEHDTGHLCGARPLLVMDVFEHAYMEDYGTDRKKYMSAFFANLKWDAVQDRFLKGADGFF